MVSGRATLTDFIISSNFRPNARSLSTYGIPSLHIFDIDLDISLFNNIRPASLGIVCSSLLNERFCAVLIHAQKYLRFGATVDTCHFQQKAIE